MERVLTVWVLSTITQREIKAEQKEQEKIRLLKQEASAGLSKFADMDWDAIDTSTSNTIDNDTTNDLQKKFGDQLNMNERKDEKQKHDKIEEGNEQEDGVSASKTKQNLTSSSSSTVITSSSASIDNTLSNQLGGGDDDDDSLSFC
mmetsp:Transcript_30994/g.36507  ORF Transcript_30994/g.36507 Transcript_30994/m.36507 type:complete len:146 (+) Transcript_30994:69-506(+)